MTLQAATVKRCRVCLTQFPPRTSTQIVCGLRCAQSLPVLARKEHKAKLDALKPRAHWAKEAQAAFNAYIRERDRLRGCISCGRQDHATDGLRSHGWDAGHYLTTGARPELRFDEANCHKQCVTCNRHLHGNSAMFRLGLVQRVGLPEVMRLEGPGQAKHYSADALRALRDHYKGLLRGLRAVA